MDKEGLSTHALAKKCGVSQRSIVNILNQDTSPSLDNVEKIAAYFRLNLWHLIIPTLVDGTMNGDGVGSLIDSYQKYSPEGRAHISSVAEREAEYSTRNKK